MIKKLLLELGWINLYVTVSVFDDEIEEVLRVEAEGTQTLLKCDRIEFLKCFEGELYELLQEELRTDYIAHCEMQMDAMKEEGITKK